jgi:hypothetical protein
VSRWAGALLVVVSCGSGAATDCPARTLEIDVDLVGPCDLIPPDESASTISVAFGDTVLTPDDARARAVTHFEFDLPATAQEGEPATATFHALGDPIGSADGSTTFALMPDECQQIRFDATCVMPAPGR